MALSFPLSAAQFYDMLRVRECSFDLGEAMQYAQTGAGEVITTSLGTRLWSGSVNLALGTHAQVAETEAVLMMLREPGRSFFAYDFARQYPAADPGGLILGASTPQIASLPSSREIAISGLPASYTLTPGDRLSFEYGSSPTRYALHQVVIGGVSDGAGNLTVEVTPSIRSGATAGAVISLVRPQMKAILVPGSTQVGASSAIVTGGSTFNIIQTLR